MKWWDAQGALIAVTFGTFNTLLVAAFGITVTGGDLDSEVFGRPWDYGVLASLWAATSFCTKRGWYGVGHPLRGRIDILHAISSGAAWGAAAAALFIMAIVLSGSALAIVTNGGDEKSFIFSVLVLHSGMAVALIAALVGLFVGPVIALIDVTTLVVFRRLIWWPPAFRAGDRS